MTNPPPANASGPLRQSRATGEAKLVDVPKIRIAVWLAIAAITLAGIVLYFVYGDFVTPVLVIHEPSSTDLLAVPPLFFG